MEDLSDFQLKTSQKPTIRHYVEIFKHIENYKLCALKFITDLT